MFTTRWPAIKLIFEDFFFEVEEEEGEEERRRCWWHHDHPRHDRNDNYLPLAGVVKIRTSHASLFGKKKSRKKNDLNEIVEDGGWSEFFLFFSFSLFFFFFWKDFLLSLSVWRLLWFAVLPSFFLWPEAIGFKRHRWPDWLPRTAEATNEKKKRSGNVAEDAAGLGPKQSILTAG